MAEKRKGTENNTITESMNIIARYVQKLWIRFKNVPKGKIGFPARMAKPLRGHPTRRKRSAVLNIRCTPKFGVSRI